MPFQLNRGDRKILLVASATFVALVLAALLLASPGSNRQIFPTTYSVDSDGAKAAYLLLGRIGFHVERWERPLAEISPEKDAILILAEPSRVPGKEDIAALHRFIEQGGTLIVTGLPAEFLMPVKPDFIASPFERTWKSFPATAPSSIARAAPRITLAPQAYWVLPSDAIPLYGEENETVVARYSYGKGSVFWWASATPLTNAGLSEPGNLEFFLACLGQGRGAHILFDEYLHGYGQNRAFTGEYTLAAGMLIQLALLGLAVVWTYSRRSGPVLPSESEVRLSPLEFIQTLGGLYRHAGASTVAVDICYKRFRYRLARRLGVSGNASAEVFENAVRDRCNFQNGRFAGVLKECAAARHQPYLSPRQALSLVRALHSYAVELKLYAPSVKEKF